MKKFRINKFRIIIRNMTKLTFSNKTYFMIIYYINVILPSSKFVLIYYFYSSGRAVENDAFFSTNIFRLSCYSFSFV